jgi:hypothetical protein
MTLIFDDLQKDIVMLTVGKHLREIALGLRRDFHFIQHDSELRWLRGFVLVLRRGSGTSLNITARFGGFRVFLCHS